MRPSGFEIWLSVGARKVNQASSADASRTVTIPQAARNAMTSREANPPGVRDLRGQVALERSGDARSHHCRARPAPQCQHRRLAGDAAQQRGIATPERLAEANFGGRLQRPGDHQIGHIETAEQSKGQCGAKEELEREAIVLGVGCSRGMTANFRFGRWGFCA